MQHNKKIYPDLDEIQNHENKEIISDLTRCRNA